MDIIAYGPGIQATLDWNGASVDLLLVFEKAFPIPRDGIYYVIEGEPERLDYAPLLALVRRDRGQWELSGIGKFDGRLPELGPSPQQILDNAKIQALKWLRPYSPEKYRVVIVPDMHSVPRSPAAASAALSLAGGFDAHGEVSIAWAAYGPREFTFASAHIDYRLAFFNHVLAALHAAGFDTETLASSAAYFGDPDGCTFGFIPQ